MRLSIAHVSFDKGWGTGGGGIRMEDGDHLTVLNNLYEVLNHKDYHM